MSEENYAADLAEKTRQALSAEGVDAALQLVNDAAVQTKWCDLAGVTTTGSDGSLTTKGATEQLVVELDRAQYALREGPCVDAAYDDEDLLHTEDVGRDPRWPRWGPIAADAGISSIISVNLHDGIRSLGALNLYSRSGRSYSYDDLVQARLVAAHASIAMGHFRGTENLWRAVESRHRIGQAQGILMERFKLNPDGAFDVLKRIARELEIKLNRIAEHLVTTGELPRQPSDVAPLEARRIVGDEPLVDPIGG